MKLQSCLEDWHLSLPHSALSLTVASWGGRGTDLAPPCFVPQSSVFQVHVQTLDILLVGPICISDMNFELVSSEGRVPNY